MNQVLRFLKEEEGPTALEYAMLISLICVAAIVGIALFGQNASDSIDMSSDSIGEAVGR